MQAKPVRQGRNRNLIEGEDKHGLLLVKCSRIMIGVSYESRLNMTDTGGFSSTGYCCANTLSTLRHAALHRWCTLDSLCSAVHSIHVCSALRARRRFISFTLNVKYQQGMKFKDTFCCVIQNRTQCAKSPGLLLFSLDTGWICRSCATVHLSVVMQGDDS